MHYVILNVILYAFHKLNGAKLTFYLTFVFVSRIQNDVPGDLMRDTKLSWESLKL